MSSSEQKTPAPTGPPTPSSPHPIPATSITTTFTSTTTNLTSSHLNATIHSYSDEYFAPAINLLNPTAPIRRPGVFVHTGAWYDGWETRRHNKWRAGGQAFDWVIVRLGCVAVVEGVEVDTAFFSGNEAPEVGVDGLFFGVGQQHDQKDGKGDREEGLEDGGTQGWDEILSRQPCGPSQRHAWRVAVAVADNEKTTRKEYTHLRLKMYPDGGIARLRVYGHAIPPALEAVKVSTGESRPVEELSSALNGGIAVACSDQHFGVMSNLILPGRGKDMGDGWETARSRTEGHVDWVICRLGLKGRSVDKIVVDTKDFRGNFPQAVTVHGWLVEDQGQGGGQDQDPGPESGGWVQLVRSEKRCQADTEHVYQGEDLLDEAGFEGRVLTHVKLTIIPDGGVKRLRVFGRRA